HRGVGGPRPRRALGGQASPTRIDTPRHTAHPERRSYVLVDDRRRRETPPRALDTLLPMRARERDLFPRRPRHAVARNGRTAQRADAAGLKLWAAKLGVPSDG